MSSSSEEKVSQDERLPRRKSLTGKPIGHVSEDVQLSLSQKLKARADRQLLVERLIIREPVSPRVGFISVHLFFLLLSFSLPLFLSVCLSLYVCLSVSLFPLPLSLSLLSHTTRAPLYTSQRLLLSKRNRTGSMICWRSVGLASHLCS